MNPTERREALKAAMEEAYTRAATMLRCGDLAGWRDWTAEAVRIGERLAEATDLIDRAA